MAALPSTVARIHAAKQCSDLLVIRDDLNKAGKTEQAMYVHETYLSCYARKNWMLAGAGIAGVSVLAYVAARALSRRQ